MSALHILISALEAAPYVTAQVGQHIYAGRASQNAPLPNLVVTTASERDPIDLDRRGGLREARAVVVCRGETFPSAEDLGEAVIAALAAYISPDGAEIDRGDIDSSTAVDVEKKPLFMRTLGFVVWHGD